MARRNIDQGKPWIHLYQKLTAKSYAKMLFENPLRFKWDLAYFDITEEE